MDRDVAEPVVIASDAKGCIVVQHGMVVVIRRAPVDARHVADLHRALESAQGPGSGRVVMLTAYRLSPDFPIEVENTTSGPKYVPTLREMDRAVAAYAMVVELGGVRAASLRAIARLVWALARPRAALGIFDRLTDAVSWLAPRGREIGAPGDSREYVQLYRIADQILESIDGGARARG